MSDEWNGWVQGALVPPEVLEVRLRVGIVPSGDHLQSMVEAIDATSGVLLSAWSIPHAPLADVQQLLTTSIDQLRAAVEGLVDPF